MNYRSYIFWSIIPVVMFFIPTACALVLCCLGGCYRFCKSNERKGYAPLEGSEPPLRCKNCSSKKCCCKCLLMKCGDCIDKTVIHKLVVHRYGVKKNKFYGYKVSAPVIYYLFFLSIFLFSATSGIFWKKFLVRESHSCNIKDNVQCFYVKNKTPVDCSVDKSDKHIVCFKFVFAFNDAASAAAGALVACGTVFAAIAIIALILSGGGGEGFEKWCEEKFKDPQIPLQHNSSNATVNNETQDQTPDRTDCYIKLCRWCLTVVALLSIFAVATALYVYTIHFIHTKSDHDVTETINISIIYVTVLLSCLIPFYCFQIE